MKVNQGNNQYCGPAVLSILTGMTTDEAALEIKKLNPSYYRGDVRGVMPQDLINTIKRQGLEVQQESISFNCSLFRVCYHAYTNPGVYLVGLPRHVAAIEVTKDKQIYFCDNHTKQSINIESAARSRFPDWRTSPAGLPDSGRSRLLTGPATSSSASTAAD